MTGWTPPLIPRSADQQERGVRLTPPALFRELERRYLRGACNLDAAASAENALAECWFDLEHSAIAHRWRPAGARSRLLGDELEWAEQDGGRRGRVWCNPPFAEIEAFVEAGIRAVEQGDAEVVVWLVPARTTMPWWHRLTRAGAVLVPILGRVEYALPVDQVDDSQLELGVDAAPGRKRPTGGAFEHSVVWVLERQLVAGDYR